MTTCRYSSEQQNSTIARWQLCRMVKPSELTQFVEPELMLGNKDVVYPIKADASEDNCTDPYEWTHIKFDYVEDQSEAERLWQMHEDWLAAKANREDKDTNDTTTARRGGNDTVAGGNNTDQGTTAPAVNDTTAGDPGNGTTVPPGDNDTAAGGNDTAADGNDTTAAGGSQLQVRAVEVDNENDPNCTNATNCFNTRGGYPEGILCINGSFPEKKQHGPPKIQCRREVLGCRHKYGRGVKQWMKGADGILVPTCEPGYVQRRVVAAGEIITKCEPAGVAAPPSPSAEMLRSPSRGYNDAPQI